MSEGHDVVGLDTGFYDGCDFGPYEPEPRLALDLRDVRPSTSRGSTPSCTWRLSRTTPWETWHRS